MKIVASARRGNLAVIIGLLAASICAAAAAPTPLPLTTNELYQASCPQLPLIVRAVVDQARRQDVQITAGLLRIFFHDCLPQSCDGSIFLDVSYADILALATRDAVILTRGPSYNISLGRRDSLRPASADEIGILPGPNTDVNTLLSIFRRKGLSDPADLVALSGGHTVGKASCGFIRANDDFTKNLARQCSASPSRKQSLDVTTPDTFDNRYYVNLRNRQGVFVSDQGLFDHPSTRALVHTFADNQQAFFNQFGSSMTKMSNLRSAAAGEIRSTCFKPNGRIRLDEAPGTEDIEGLAASA